MQLYLVIQITEQCQQRCRHCLVNKGEKLDNPISMTWKQMNSIVNKIKQFCERYNTKASVSILGGDPFLHPDFINFTELLCEYEIGYNVVCNPYNITEDLCRKLKQHKCESIGFSIDGMRKTHDYIRSKGSFDKTIEKIETIKKAGIKINIQSTISDINIKEIPDVIDLAYQKKVDFLTLCRYAAINENMPNTIKPLEYRDFLDKCYKKNILYNNFKIFIKDPLFLLYKYENNLWELPKNNKSKQVKLGCNCSFMMYICANGDVLPCGVIEEKVGNIFEDNIINIIDNNKMKHFRYINKYEKCKKCELLLFCRGCPGVNYNVTHNFYAPDPQCWKEI